MKHTRIPTYSTLMAGRRPPPPPARKDPWDVGLAIMSLTALIVIWIVCIVTL